MHLFMGLHKPGPATIDRMAKAASVDNLTSTGFTTTNNIASLRQIHADIKAAGFGGFYRVTVNADVGNTASWRQKPLPPPAAEAH